jgi:hypothetical protein
MQRIATIDAKTALGPAYDRTKQEGIEIQRGDDIGLTRAPSEIMGFKQAIAVKTTIGLHNAVASAQSAHQVENIPRRPELSKSVQKRGGIEPRRTMRQRY